MKAKAKNMGIWAENDAYVPSAEIDYLRMERSGRGDNVTGSLVMVQATNGEL